MKVALALLVLLVLLQCILSAPLNGTVKSLGSVNGWRGPKKPENITAALNEVMDLYYKINGKSRASSSNAGVMSVSGSTLVWTCVGWADNPFRMMTFPNQRHCSTSGWTEYYAFVNSEHQDEDHGHYPYCLAQAWDPHRAMLLPGVSSCSVDGWSQTQLIYGANKDDHHAESHVFKSDDNSRIAFYPHDGVVNGYYKLTTMQHHGLYQQPTNEHLSIVKKRMDNHPHLFLDYPFFIHSVEGEIERAITRVINRFPRSGLARNSVAVDTPASTLFPPSVWNAVPGAIRPHIERIRYVLTAGVDEGGIFTRRLTISYDGVLRADVRLNYWAIGNIPVRDALAESLRDGTVVAVHNGFDGNLALTIALGLLYMVLL